MCYPNHYCCRCGCYHCNCHTHCGCHCCHSYTHWYQPQVVWYTPPPPTPFVVAQPPVEKKIDRILELAERAEKRAKVNKKHSSRW